MEDRFIEIGNRILDYRRYKAEVALLRQLMLKETMEYLESLGFEIRKKKQSKYDKAELEFYNENLDLALQIAMRKRGESRFV